MKNRREKDAQVIGKTGSIHMKQKPGGKVLKSSEKRRGNRLADVPSERGRRGKQEIQRRNLGGGETT